MIYTMDIGNTNIKTALFDGEKLVHYWRISTNHSYTSDEYGVMLDGMFRHANLEMGLVTAVMISSVVPTINFTIDHMCRDYFHVTPLFVNPGIKTGLISSMKTPRNLGSGPYLQRSSCQRIWCALHFYRLWYRNNLGAIDAKGAFWAAASAQHQVGSHALVTRTSKLPQFELMMPPKVICRTTVTNMQAGLLYGYVGQVNYIVERMKEELDDDKIKVIATGGMSRLIATESKAIQHIDGLLTLKGLRLLQERNGTA